MKNITSEMKNILVKINSRLGTTEEPENIAMETIQNETQRRKRLEKKKQSSNDIWYNTMQSNMHVIRLPKGQK